MGLEKVRPGGRRVRHMLRLAEADTDFVFCRLISARISNTAEPGKGLAVFNRSAHSAGPGTGRWEMAEGRRGKGRGTRDDRRGKWEEGRWKWDEGRGKGDNKVMFNVHWEKRHWKPKMGDQT